jgi:hypothetical protein
MHVALLASRRRGWNTTTLGVKIEAFAIAGCDVGSSFFILKSYSFPSADWFSFSHEQDLEKKAQCPQDNNYNYSAGISWYVNIFQLYLLHSDLLI